LDLKENSSRRDIGGSKKREKILGQNMIKSNSDGRIREMEGFEECLFLCHNMIGSKKREEERRKGRRGR